MLSETFSNHGVRFDYPGDWEISEQARDGERSVTVSSPGTAFWSLSLYFDKPDPEEVMETALAAFREEYPELDAYPGRDRVCDQQTLAQDIEFVCWDLLNSAWVRVFRTEEFTALVLYQGNDRELESCGEILTRMTRSLTCI